MERSSRIRPTNVSFPNPNKGGTEEEEDELGIERDRARAWKWMRTMGSSRMLEVAGKEGAPPLAPPALMPATRQPAMQNRSPKKNTGRTGPQDRSNRSCQVNLQLAFNFRILNPLISYSLILPRSGIFECSEVVILLPCLAQHTVVTCSEELMVTELTDYILQSAATLGVQIDNL